MYPYIVAFPPHGAASHRRDMVIPQTIIIIDANAWAFGF